MVENLSSLNFRLTMGSCKTLRSGYLRRPNDGNYRGFGVISIVIDYDRGHSYKRLKKINSRWKLNARHEFECLCMRWIFELPEMAKN